MLTVHYSGLNGFLHGVIVISTELHCVLFMFAYEAFFFSLPLCNLFTVCNLSVLSFLFLFFQNCSYCLCLMFCFCEGYPLSYWPLSLFSVYIDKNIQVCIFVVLIIHIVSPHTPPALLFSLYLFCFHFRSVFLCVSICVWKHVCVCTCKQACTHFNGKWYLIICNSLN